jgi:hypothetical protein
MIRADHLSRISPALLPLAERLIVAGHLERRAIWDEFLARGFDRAPTAGTTPEPERTADAVKDRGGVTSYRYGFGPGSRFYWGLERASSREP